MLHFAISGGILCCQPSWKVTSTSEAKALALLRTFLAQGRTTSDRHLSSDSPLGLAEVLSGLPCSFDFSFDPVLLLCLPFHWCQSQVPSLMNIQHIKFHLRACFLQNSVYSRLCSQHCQYLLISLFCNCLFCHSLWPHFFIPVLLIYCPFMNFK